MNKIKKILFIFAFLLLLTNPFSAKAFDASYIGKNDPIPGGFDFTPKYGGKAIFSDAYEKWSTKCDVNSEDNYKIGCSKKNNDNAGMLAGFNKNTNLKDTNGNAKFYVIYPNVGYYDDDRIDMKVSLVNIQFNSKVKDHKASFKFGSDKIAIYNWSSDASKTIKGLSGAQLAHFVYKIEFFKHCDKYDNTCKYESPGSMKTVINFTDLDPGERISFNKSNLSQIYFLDLNKFIDDFGFSNYSQSFVYGRMATDFGVSIENIKNEDLNRFNHLEIRELNNRVYVIPNENFVISCKDSNKNDVECENYTDSIIYFNGNGKNGNSTIDEINKTLRALIKRGGMSTVLFKTSSISVGWSGYYTSLQNSPSNPIKEASPTKYVYKINEDGSKINIHSDVLEKDVTHQDYSDYNLKYVFQQKVPLANKEFKYCDHEEKDQNGNVICSGTWYLWDYLPNEIDYVLFDTNNIIIRDNNGNNVRDWFEISLSDDNVKGKKVLKIEAKKGIVSMNEFYGKTYFFEVPFKLQKQLGKRTIYNAVSHDYTLKDKAQTHYNQESKQVYFTLNEKKYASCTEELDDLKQYLNANPNADINVVDALDDLFIKYRKKDKKGYNKLFNYKVEGNGKINIESTSCEVVSCSSVTNNSDSLSCNGENNILKQSLPNDSNVDPRVCYMGSSYSNNGSFYDEYSDSYCSVSMSYNLKFKENVAIGKSQILWEGLNHNSRVGVLNMKISCENFYQGVTSQSINNNLHNLNVKKFINNILPEINYSWNNENSNLYFNYNGISDISLKNGKSQYSCNNSTSQPYCYIKWVDDFEIPIEYSSDRHLCVDSNGNFENYSNLQPEIRSTQACAWGLNISPNLTLTDIEKNASGLYQKGVDFTISSPLLDNDYNSTCNYFIKNGLFPSCVGPNCDKKLNLKFRSIDVINPFPGLNGDVNGRYTGSNWCLTSFVGTVRYDNKGIQYLVGDLDKSGTLDADIYNNLTANSFQINYLDNPAADIDGDGVVTIPLSGSCDSEPFNDYCVLGAYFDDNFDSKLLCLANNSLVNTYIKDAVSSSSLDDKPMYSFTLTSSDIKSIRDYYNKNNSYSDFNLKCSNGENCKSEFITNILNNKINNEGNFVSTSDVLNDSNSRCYYLRHDDDKWCSNN